MTKYKTMKFEGKDRNILPGRKNVVKVSRAKLIIAIVIFIVLISAAIIYRSSQNKDYSAFASCINASGAKFYGTFLCSHCEGQKEMFGDAQKLLPFTECSTPDGEGQLQVCADAGIKGYPTWVFPDGSRLTGAVPLKKLAEKTGCKIS